VVRIEGERRRKVTSKSILVTGANGLIGYAVATELARQGRSVIGLVRIRPVRDECNFDTYEGDLTDIHRLHSLFKAHSIDGIIHSAAVSGPMLARDNPYALCLTNIMGTANILETARINGVRRIVYTSSTAAYGDTPRGPIKEETPLRPKNVYGATKASSEHLLRAYAVQHNFEGVSLRIAWVFGPRRRTDCLIRTMIEDALEGRPTRLGWGLGFYRQYIYVDDVVSATIAALDAPSLRQEVYNVTGGTDLTIDQVAEAVHSVLPGAEIHLSPGPDPVDTIQGEFDISAIKRDLGFSPCFSLKQGIQAYHRWICKQRAL
jgi:nucleoside-diphosphate-sugar epimerase